MNIKLNIYPTKLLRQIFRRSNIFKKIIDVAIIRNGNTDDIKKLISIQVDNLYVSGYRIHLKYGIHV